MIISRAEVASAISAYRTVKRKSPVASVSFDTTDSFERSEAAASLAADFAEATEPFYRRDLVERLKRQVSDGRYFVPAEEIVEKLLGRLIVQRLAAAA